MGGYGGKPWVSLCSFSAAAAGRFIARLALSPRLPHALSQPPRDIRRDLEVVLLDHQHVSVAADADILQPHEVVRDTGLSEILRGAVIVHRVIRRLRGE